MCGPLRPTPVRAEHEVETSGSRVFIAVSETDKRRKPHQTPAGQESRSSPTPKENIFCALFAIQPHRAASLGAHATVTHNLLSATLPLEVLWTVFFAHPIFLPPHIYGAGSLGSPPLLVKWGAQKVETCRRFPKINQEIIRAPKLLGF